MVRNLRIFTRLACLAAVLFWVYTFYHISQLPVGDGSGFQWIAEMPLSAIVLLLILPAFALSFKDRFVGLAALLAVIGLGLDAVLWPQLLSEFQPG